MVFRSPVAFAAVQSLSNLIKTALSASLHWAKVLNVAIETTQIMKIAFFIFVSLLIKTGTKIDLHARCDEINTCSPAVEVALLPHSRLCSNWRPLCHRFLQLRRPRSQLPAR